MQTEGSLPHSQQPPPVPILSQIDSVGLHVPTNQVSKIHFNIILPSMPGSFKWPPSLKFPHQNPLCTSSLPIRATYRANITLYLTNKCTFEVENTQSYKNYADMFRHHRHIIRGTFAKLSLKPLQSVHLPLQLRSIYMCRQNRIQLKFSTKIQRTAHL